jgi:hypothetical protein
LSFDSSYENVGAQSQNRYEKVSEENSHKVYAPHVCT